MEITSHNFWIEYPRLVAQVFTPLTPEDGLPEADVIEAEQRLEVSLPVLLRNFYLRAGKREDINATYNHLFSPQKLEVHEGCLIFFTENQGVIEWGIPLDSLGEPDPPVWNYMDSGEPWRPDMPTLSGFLATQFVLQAVMGQGEFGEVNTSLSRFEAATVDWERFTSEYLYGAITSGMAALFFLSDDPEEECLVWYGYNTDEQGEYLGRAFALAEN